MLNKINEKIKKNKSVVYSLISGVGSGTVIYLVQRERYPENTNLTGYHYKGQKVVVDYSPNDDFEFINDLYIKFYGYEADKNNPYYLLLQRGYSRPEVAVQAVNSLECYIGMLLNEWGYERGTPEYDGLLQNWIVQAETYDGNQERTEWIYKAFKKQEAYKIMGNECYVDYYGFPREYIRMNYTNGKSNEEWIDEAYKLILGREPDDEGRAYYLDRVGVWGREKIAKKLAKSREKYVKMLYMRIEGYAYHSGLGFWNDYYKKKYDNARKTTDGDYSTEWAEQETYKAFIHESHIMIFRNPDVSGEMKIIKSTQNDLDGEYQSIIVPSHRHCVVYPDVNIRGGEGFEINSGWHRNQVIYSIKVL